MASRDRRPVSQGPSGFSSGPGAPEKQPQLTASGPHPSPTPFQEKDLIYSVISYVGEFVLNRAQCTPMGLGEGPLTKKQLF